MTNSSIQSVLYAVAMKQFIQSLKNRHMSTETIRGYTVDLNQLQNHLSGIKNGPIYLDEVTEEEVESFHQGFRTAGMKPATLRRKLNSSSSFFNFAVKKKWMAFNPAQDIDRVPIRNQERTYLNQQELQALLQAVEHPIIQAFVTMMAHTGLRVSECANLRLKDVDFKKKEVSVIEGKGGKNRQVPMNEILLQQMKTYVENVRPATTSVNFFATAKTGAVSPQYVNQHLKKAAEAAGIDKNVTSHALRHSFASQLVRGDVHVAVIKDLLGHADVRTTSVYMHTDLSDMQDAVNALPFLNEGGPQA